MHKTKKKAKVPAEVVGDSQQQKQHSSDDTILQKKVLQNNVSQKDERIPVSFDLINMAKS
jgi:hypothetical protein